MASARAAQAARIFIVDDHPVMRLGLRTLISSEPDLEVCGETDNIPTALTLVEQGCPDIVLVDISLKGGSGIELIKQITARCPSLRILVVSMHDESLFAERALRAGALGYINKDEAINKGVDAIRQVLSGKVYLSDRMTEHMLGVMANRDRADGSPLANLSDRELEVFEQIGHGVGTREIAEQLMLSVKTIETYRENIKRKLVLQTNTELIRRAVQWVLEQ
jgi:DNA-binding NarL/FixJ family response regulator